MDKKQIRMYYVLLLGYTVLNTDAAVTITPHNALSDGISFEEGSEGVIMCTINPYLNYVTWKIDNIVAAECLQNCNIHLSTATYAFTFDTANGIFNITINYVNGTDEGKVFLCDDGSDPATFTVRVKEKRTLIDRTVTGRCWCSREKAWCVVVSLIGGYIFQCIVMKCRRRYIKNKGHEVETKLLGLEKELEEKRKQFREKVEKRDNEWHKCLATLNAETIKPIEDALAKHDIKREQEDLNTNKRKKELVGIAELRKRKGEIGKVYKKNLERQSLTKEKKEEQLEQKLKDMETKINVTIESFQEGKQIWRNRKAKLETVEENYRKMIVNESIIQAPVAFDKEIQLNYRHEQNELRIKEMEQEIHRKRNELCLIKKNREKKLKDMIANIKDTLKEKIAERESALEQLTQGSRARKMTDRLTIYRVKRKILHIQRESRERTLMFEIVELEENYGVLPEEDDWKNKENKLPNSNIVELINEIEETEEEYEQVIQEQEQEERQKEKEKKEQKQEQEGEEEEGQKKEERKEQKVVKEEKENTQEESCCLKYLPFIPYIGIILSIILYIQAAKRQTKVGDNRGSGVADTKMSKK